MRILFEIVCNYVTLFYALNVSEHLKYEEFIAGPFPNFIYLKEKQNIKVKSKWKLISECSVHVQCRYYRIRFIDEVKLFGIVAVDANDRRRKNVFVCV